MSKYSNDIKIEKREWQTYYDPKDVGAYLNWYYDNFKFSFEPGEIIDMPPRAILPLLPSPSLEGFLRWIATPTPVKKELKK